MSDFLEWAGQNPGPCTLGIALWLLGAAFLLDLFVKPDGGDE